MTKHGQTRRSNLEASDTGEGGYNNDHSICSKGPKADLGPSDLVITIRVLHNAWI